MSLRSVAVFIGRTVGAACRRTIEQWRWSRAGLGRSYHALNDLRRRYVFGAVSRETYDESMKRLRRWRGRTRTSRSSRRRGRRAA